MLMFFKQGIRVIFDDNSRAVFRLSGTAGNNATIRVYIEKFEQHPDASKTLEVNLSLIINL